MNSRIFRQNGAGCSEVGLGTLADWWNWGEVTDETALATLRAAIEAAPRSSLHRRRLWRGRSETLIGRFLKEQKRPREQPFFIATKLAGGRFPACRKRCAGAQHTTDSLRPAGVKALDLTQFTGCRRKSDARRVFGWLEELKTRRKNQGVCASVEAMNEALWCARSRVRGASDHFQYFPQKPIHACRHRPAQRVALTGGCRWERAAQRGA